MKIEVAAKEYLVEIEVRKRTKNSLTYILLYFNVALIMRC